MSRVKGVLEFAGYGLNFVMNLFIRRDLKLCFDLGGHVGRYSNMDPLLGKNVRLIVWGDCNFS